MTRHSRTPQGVIAPSRRVTLKAMLVITGSPPDVLTRAEHHLSRHKEGVSQEPVRADDAMRRTGDGTCSHDAIEARGRAHGVSGGAARWRWTTISLLAASYTPCPTQRQWPMQRSGMTRTTHADTKGLFPARGCQPSCAVSRLASPSSSPYLPSPHKRRHQAPAPNCGAPATPAPHLVPRFRCAAAPRLVPSSR